MAPQINAMHQVLIFHVKQAKGSDYTRRYEEYIVASVGKSDVGEKI